MGMFFLPKKTAKTFLDGSARHISHARNQSVLLGEEFVDSVVIPFVDDVLCTVLFPGIADRVADGLRSVGSLTDRI